MDESDSWPVLGVIISTILGVLSFFSQIPGLQWITALLIGAFITYAVQSKLQDRRLKGQIRKENIEEIYALLYLEIKNIRENLLQYPTHATIDVWRKFRETYRIFAIGTTFVNKLTDFYDRVEELSIDINKSKNLVKDALYDKFVEKFLPSIGNENYKIQKSSDRPGFNIRYEKKLRIEEINIINYALINKNPLNGTSERDSNFSIENCYIEFTSTTLPDPIYADRSNIPIKLHLNKYLDEFNSFLKAVEEVLGVNIIIKRIRNESSELIDIAKNLESKIDKYIKKYYPTEIM